MSASDCSNKANVKKQNGRHAYIIVNSESKSSENIYDPKCNRDYLTLKPTTGPIFAEKSASDSNLNKCTEDKIIVSRPFSPINKSTDLPSCSNFSSHKIPTGMDRYITITKRKSSPRAANTEPDPKMPRTNEGQNRFAILGKMANNNTEKPEQRAIKPPPIYLREVCTNSLVSKLSKLIGKDHFYVVSIRKGNVLETKIQADSEKGYRAIVNNFDAEKKGYYTYQLKSAKGLVVVIKGIDNSVPTEDIKDALKNAGFDAKSIFNIINREKIPQPMFKVEVAFDSTKLKKNETHPIYNLKFLLNRRIVVEEPIKRKGPPQCQNCQEFGHTKSFCKLPSVCVRCGDIHKSLECPHPKSDTNVRKCGNCGEKHTANYRGCKVFLQLKNSNKARRSVPVPLEYKETNFPNLPTTSARATQRAQGTNVQHVSFAETLKKGNTSQESHRVNSYANVLKEGEHKPLPDTQSAIEKLIDTMNSFMSNMQGMFQQMLQNQSMLMQILLNKK